MMMTTRSRRMNLHQLLWSRFRTKTMSTDASASISASSSRLTYKYRCHPQISCSTKSLSITNHNMNAAPYVLHHHLPQSHQRIQQRQPLSTNSQSSSNTVTDTDVHTNNRNSNNINPNHHNQKHKHRFVIDELKEAIARGDMVHDIAQVRAAKRLTQLQNALIGYSNDDVIARVEEHQRKVEMEANRELERTRKEEKVGKTDRPAKESQFTPEKDINTDVDRDPPIQVPRGLFLHGKVGTGKTHLMDLFYHQSTQSQSSLRSKRVHFHSFMQEIHLQIHTLKQRDLLTTGRNFTIDTTPSHNPIHRVAIQLASEVSLLCFDEFQVTDVADALILRQLFEELWRRGVVVVATSNRHPSMLYENGLNRSYFLPFVDMIQRYCIVYDMDGEVDYRVVGTEGCESLFFCGDESGSNSKSTNGDKDVNGREKYEEFLKGLMAGDDDGNANTSASASANSSMECNLKIQAAFNRTVVIPQVFIHNDGNGDAFQVARFHFKDLCCIELGSSDYRAIAQQFDAIVIDEIPLLTLKEHDQARRFITLVDELYEAKCALACLSVVSDPSSLFVGQHRDNNDRQVSDESSDDLGGVETEVGEAFGIDVAQSNGVSVGGLASVQELSFAFKRAASRLKEMTSIQWWERKRQDQIG